MKSNFDKSLKYTLAWEGGYSDHPDDPGGKTNFGVTAAVYNAYRRAKGLPIRHVREITMAEVKDIYKRQYWDRVQGDRLPVGLDYAMFDYAVNSGVARAASALQEVLGLKRDGVVGEITLSKIPDEQERVVEALCRQRYAFVRRLSTWKSFGKGWTRRIMGNSIGVQDGDKGVIDIAYAMAKNEAPPPLPKTDPQSDGAFAKADAKDTKLTTEPEAVAQGASGLSFGGFLSGDWIISGLQYLGEIAGFTKDQLEPLTDYSPYIKGVFVACFVFSVVGAVGLKLRQRKEGVVV